MKNFQTSSVDVVQECQTVFNFRRVPELIFERKRIFCKNFARVKMAYVKFLFFFYGDG